MNEALKIVDHVAVNVDRARNLEDQIPLSGKFHVEHYDKDGNLKGKYDVSNAITDAGKNKLLDVMFHGVTAIGTWYIGLIDNAGWTAESVSDTLASHSGWTEFTTYTGNRQEWTEGAAAAKSTTNSTPVSFSITGSGVLKGIFICSAATGTSGTLWSTADYGSPLTVTNGDTLRITYTVNA